MSSTPATLGTVQGIAVLLYATCQAGLVGYSAHRWQMLGRDRRPPAAPEPWWPDEDPPRVLVQLPVRDEPAVVARLVAAAAALDWPHHRLEVQLLDDSGDAAAAIGAAAVARARSLGVNARHVRRAHRHGFKAGALAAGLARSDAEFVAVFDADFVPPPEFLRRTLPRFGAPTVGLVQARWGHLNRDANLLTRAQAAMLDAHLLVEHTWRQRTGRFLNFNGTAGVWRRGCIESAGGWSHDTLTEDLDLSYRAQLAGWRFVFDPTLVVPAELPESMAAFRSQQHRWARGALQTARKLLPRVFQAPLPWHVKTEAFVHLTANATYPLVLALATLLVPVLLGARTAAGTWLLGLHVAVVGAGTLPVILFLLRGQRLAGRRGARVCVDVAAAVVLCCGLSWRLACAVAEGVWCATGEFVRTPKTGAGAAGLCAAGRPDPARAGTAHPPRGPARAGARRGVRARRGLGRRLGPAGGGAVPARPLRGARVGRARDPGKRAGARRRTFLRLAPSPPADPSLRQVRRNPRRSYSARVQLPSGLRRQRTPRMSSQSPIGSPGTFSEPRRSTLPSRSSTCSSREPQG